MKFSGTAVIIAGARGNRGSRRQLIGNGEALRALKITSRLLGKFSMALSPAVVQRDYKIQRAEHAHVLAVTSTDALCNKATHLYIRTTKVAEGLRGFNHLLGHGVHLLLKLLQQLLRDFLAGAFLEQTELSRQEKRASVSS